MKKYTSPYTEIIPIQLQSAVLVGSGNKIPVAGGDSQVHAW